MEDGKVWLRHMGKTVWLILKKGIRLQNDESRTKVLKSWENTIKIRKQ